MDHDKLIQIAIEAERCKPDMVAEVAPKLLWDAFKLIFPAPIRDAEHEYHKQYREFNWKINAGAFIDAALMLLPPGDENTRYSATIWAGNSPWRRDTSARVFRYDRDNQAEGGWTLVAKGLPINASNSGLALLAWICREWADIETGQQSVIGLVA